MKLLMRLVRGIFYFPKTVYVNFKTLPFDYAIRLPIIIMGKVKFVGLKKYSIVIDALVNRGMIIIGPKKSARSGVPVNTTSKIIFRKEGRIVFKGRASFGAGSSIVTSDTITFGNRFSCNVNCFISCSTKMTFDEDVLIGWNVNIRDNDGHPIYNMEGDMINPSASVNICKHVWIASYVDILKGVSIGQNNIIGYRSLVSKSILETDSIYAGSPAQKVKSDIYWEHRQELE